MEIKNKYNVNDRVFIYSEGFIIHAKISEIRVFINNNGIDYRYYLLGDNELANNHLDYDYTEDQLCSKLEDIINHIEVL